MSSVNKKKRTSSKNTTMAQYLAMVVFLEENKESKELISGEVHGKAVVAGSKLRKKDGFKEMVEFVNERCVTKWTEKQCSARWKSYNKKYKKTKRDYISNNYEKFVMNLI